MPVLLISCHLGKKEPKPDDSQLFLNKIEHFELLEEIAIESVAKQNAFTASAFLKELKTVALKDWVECVNLMDESKKLKLDQENESLRKDLHRYASMRIEETKLLISELQEQPTKKYDNSIDSIRFEISEILRDIKKKKDGLRVDVESTGG